MTNNPGIDWETVRVSGLQINEDQAVRVRVEDSDSQWKTLEASDLDIRLDGDYCDFVENKADYLSNYQSEYPERYYYYLKQICATLQKVDYYFHARFRTSFKNEYNIQLMVDLGPSFKLPNVIASALKHNLLRSYLIAVARNSEFDADKIEMKTIDGLLLWLDKQDLRIDIFQSCSLEELCVIARKFSPLLCGVLRGELDGLESRTLSNLALFFILVNLRLKCVDAATEEMHTTTKLTRSKSTPNLWKPGDRGSSDNSNNPTGPVKPANR